jgi:hypothetical protein
MGLLTVAGFGGMSPVARADDRGRDEAPQKEPSLHGAWVGAYSFNGMDQEFEFNFKANGTYVLTVDNGQITVAIKGKYSYEEGLLKTTPEGGVTETAVIQWDKNKDEFTFKGGQLRIKFKKK